MSATIFYDGDCPFCSRYVKMIRLREALGAVEMVDLRGDAVRRAELEREGFDLDQGMVVETGGRRLGGADATNALALMSTPSGVFNKLNRLVFSAPAVSGVVYPALRSGRWLTLFLMGREGINDAARDLSSRQVLFSFFFGLFSLFHVFNYAFPYGRDGFSPDLIAVFAAALLLLTRPQSARALFLLMLASLVSTIAQAPAQSNHTMLRTCVVLGYWLSFLWTFVRAGSVSDIFGNFSLAGRGSLLVMYVFGIFHKINTDFLTPETSCAVALWREMPAPLNWIDTPLMHYAAIYGTYAVEGAIMLALIFPGTRYLGLVFGIGFHLLLGLSNYAAYIAFTTLSIAMHVLFLGPVQLDRITQSREMAAIREKSVQPMWVAAFLIVLTGGALAMWKHEFSLAALFLLPFVLPLCVLILRYGQEAKGAEKVRPATPAIVIGVIAAGAYFVSGAMPYLGLKTAQSINMFANLRLEAGVSNHVVFPNPPGPFTYLEDVALIEDAGGSAFLRDFSNRGWGIVYYDLVAHLTENPELAVTYTMNGVTHAGITATDVAADADAMLHAPFIRKWFHFQPVQLDRPEGCTL